MAACYERYKNCKLKFKTRLLLSRTVRELRKFSYGSFRGGGRRIWVQEGVDGDCVLGNVGTNEALKEQTGTSSGGVVAPNKEQRLQWHGLMI